MRRSAYILIGILAAATLVAAGGWYALRPPLKEASATEFNIAPGEGFRSIALDLKAHGLVRSATAFELYAFISAEARHLKPGLYQLNKNMSVPTLVQKLVSGIDREAIVSIPEGSNIFDIDELLAEGGVLPKGEFVARAKKEKLEGYLFPSTYRFYLKSDPDAVFKKFADAWSDNISPLLPKDPNEAKKILIIASILEKEVPLEHDRQVVAGLLLKREKEGMPLQVDATVCYGKRLNRPGVPCYPVTTLDTQMESPYNTYLNKGWPPGPIGNPGTAAVKAALSPIQSPYWYYLSDPVTKNTIFSKTATEQEMNRSKYLFSPAL